MFKGTKKQQVFDLLVSSTGGKWNDGTPVKFNKDGSMSSPHGFLGPFKVREDGKVEIKNRHAKGYWVFELAKDNQTAKAIKEEGALKAGRVIIISKANKSQ